MRAMRAHVYGRARSRVSRAANSAVRSFRGVSTSINFIFVSALNCHNRLHCYEQVIVAYRSSSLCVVFVARALLILSFCRYHGVVSWIVAIVVIETLTLRRFASS